MGKKFLSILACMLMTASMALAQKQITGTVVDAESGDPLIGVAVRVPDASIGVLTDIDGKFAITLPAGKNSLTFSFMGMKPATLEARDGMKVLMETDTKAMDEVIVVAYGTATKASLTGSIQEVKSDAIELRPTSSVTSALEGTVTGVQVNNTYGVPGNDPSIRIRGIGTVNGSSSPLYILDGVPFGGNISDLNPNDIESISVLKDAASAALYGNRASNGVILITSKKGRQGKMNVTFDMKQGTYNKGLPEYERLGAREWMNAQWMSLRNNRMSAMPNESVPAGMTKEDYLASIPTASAAYADANLITDRLWLNIWDAPANALFKDGKLLPDVKMLGAYGEDLDWYDQAIGNGHRQEYNVSANGANDKSDYLISLGYLDENGYLKTSGFDRVSARVSANVQPKKWFKTGLNVNATHQNYDNRYGTSDDGYTNPFMYCRNIAPIYPVHLHDVNTGAYLLDAQGNKQYDGGSYINENGEVINTRKQFPDRHLMWENELNDDKTVRNTINGIAYMDFYLPYNFTITLKGNLNVRNTSENSYDSAVIGDGKGNSGRGKRVDYRYKNYAFQQQLHWNHDYGKHSIDALIGHENYSYTYNYLYGYKTTEVFPGINNLNNFTDITRLYDYNDTYKTESYLGRVRYGYDNRYNGEVSFRRDGSSRFSKDARWGNFWSIGANWVISNEAFMQKYDWVNFLKLRADYGEVGNDAGSGYYGYMALYNSTQNANKGAYWIGQLPNEDLMWETGQSWGIGLESRLFDKLNFSVEYFDKRNKDLLFDVYNPLSAGATSTSSAESVITKNLGTISNRGVEISADMDVFKNKDWRINVGANVTFLKNKVVTLPEQNKDGIIDGTKKIVEGKSRYQFFTYTWEGINTANGLSLYKFNDEDYFFNVTDAEGNVTSYGNTEGTEITGTNKNCVVLIDGTPYSYLTTYGKREFHGSATPNAYGSFHFTVSWKGLTLNTLFTYQLGGKVMDSNYADLMSASETPYSLHSDVLNSWTYEQRSYTLNDAGAEVLVNAVDPNGIPQLNNKALVPGTDIAADLNSTSSRWLTSASYLILKNINLTYQLPKKLVKKIDLDGVAVTVACENLFTKTARKGMNPQQNFSGTQSNTFVTPRVFSVGLNVKF